MCAERSMCASTTNLQNRDSMHVHCATNLTLLVDILLKWCHYINTWTWRKWFHTKLIFFCSPIDRPNQCDNNYSHGDHFYRIIVCYDDKMPIKVTQHIETNKPNSSVQCSPIQDDHTNDRIAPPLLWKRIWVFKCLRIISCLLYYCVFFLHHSNFFGVWSQLFQFLPDHQLNPRCTESKLSTLLIHMVDV